MYRAATHAVVSRRCCRGRQRRAPVQVCSKRSIHCSCLPVNVREFVEPTTRIVQLSYVDGVLAMQRQRQVSYQWEQDFVVDLRQHVVNVLSYA